MIVTAFVALAACGGTARWLASSGDRPGVPVGTFGVNTVASFLAGWASTFDGTARLLVTVAFLGSLSTFSSVVSRAIVDLTTVDVGRVRAVAWLATSIVAGVVAALLGLSVP